MNTVSIIPLISGILFAIFGTIVITVTVIIHNYIKKNKMTYTDTSNWIKTNGVVENVVTANKNDLSYITPEVRYFVNGYEVLGHTESYRKYCPLIGQTVDIKYDPNNPQIFEYSNALSASSGQAIAKFIIILFFVIGIFSILTSIICFLFYFIFKCII